VWQKGQHVEFGLSLYHLDSAGCHKAGSGDEVQMLGGAIMKTILTVEHIRDGKKERRVQME